MKQKKPLLLLYSSLFAVSLFTIIVSLSATSFEVYTKVPATSSPTTEETAQLPVVPKLAPILFTGDIMLGRHVERLAAQFSSTYLTASITPWFTPTQTVIVNFESAMAEPHIPTPSGAMTFSTAPAMLAVLKNLNVTHASLANNHARDYGPTGYRKTINTLKGSNITAFGDPNTVSSSSVTFIPYGEEVIALIGIHTLFNPPTPQQLQAVMEYAKASSTVQVAYIHWGNEYELTHSSAQYTLAKALVLLGIDAVIGHHPHVTQDIQLIDGIPIFYSLGNFIFDQYFSTEVQRGYILALYIDATTLRFELKPHEQCARSVPCPMTTEREQLYLEGLAERSAPALNAQIMAKNIVFNR